MSSNLNKYKSTASTSSTANNLPIWCSLSTPSQIARKYASIAPIWCHISRPRQLKQKFKSTFSTASNLLSRGHSKDDRSTRVPNDSDDDDPVGRYNDMSTAINTFKNANSSWKSTYQPTSSSYSSNIPSSTSRGKLSAYDTTNSSILKKRDTSPKPYTSSYTPSSSQATTGSRWASSSAKASKPESSIMSSYKDSYEPSMSSSSGIGSTATTPASTIVGSFYEENHLPSLSSHTGDSSTRRPNKYVSKYGGAGSKTEKIISKSSKSSPNLLDGSQYNTSTSGKWQPYTSSASQNQYHSNGQSSNNYNNSSYTPSSYNGTSSATSSNYPSLSTSTSGGNYNTTSGYNEGTSNREEKWNELDTMLGAQSALLSRLESDFVANRNKLKNTSTGGNTTGTNGTLAGGSSSGNGTNKSTYLMNSLGK